MAGAPTGQHQPDPARTRRARRLDDLLLRCAVRGGNRPRGAALARGPIGPAADRGHRRRGDRCPPGRRLLHRDRGADRAFRRRIGVGRRLSRATVGRRAHHVLGKGVTTAQTHTTDGRPRARGLGIPLPGAPGPLNAITDVLGVEVGTVTLVEGDGPLVVGSGPVRTGVTAILPRGRAGLGRACAAGWYSLNGNGEMTGTTWIEEAGAFNLPVVLSNTHAVGACHTGVVSWVNRVHPMLARQWLLPVCAETWDGYLNDINGAHVRPEHAEAALDAAVSGPVAEGSVGGGTGMNCYEYKGGNGTASRVVGYGRHAFTVAA